MQKKAWVSDRETWGTAAEKLRAIARDLGHTLARGKGFPYVEGIRYRTVCTTCGAVVAMQARKLGKGYRMLPLGKWTVPVGSYLS